jgi:hypothetical protein
VALDLGDNCEDVLTGGVGNQPRATTFINCH